MVRKSIHAASKDSLGRSFYINHIKPRNGVLLLEAFTIVEYNCTLIRIFASCTSVSPAI